MVLYSLSMFAGLVFPFHCPNSLVVPEWLFPYGSKAYWDLSYDIVPPVKNRDSTLKGILVLSLPVDLAYLLIGFSKTLQISTGTL